MRQTPKPGPHSGTSARRVQPRRRGFVRPTDSPMSVSLSFCVSLGEGGSTPVEYLRTDYAPGSCANTSRKIVPIANGMGVNLAALWTIPATRSIPGDGARRRAPDVPYVPWRVPQPPILLRGHSVYATLSGCCPTIASVRFGALPLVYPPIP